MDYAVRINASWKMYNRGIGGFALTLIFIIGFPILLSPVFPYPSPAIFAFLAPVLSALLREPISFFVGWPLT